jgi:hypothetical protein
MPLAVLCSTLRVLCGPRAAIIAFCVVRLRPLHAVVPVPLGVGGRSVPSWGICSEWASPPHRGTLYRSDGHATCLGTETIMVAPIRRDTPARRRPCMVGVGHPRCDLSAPTLVFTMQQDPSALPIRAHPSRGGAAKLGVSSGDRPATEGRGSRAPGCPGAEFTRQEGLYVPQDDTSCHGSGRAHGQRL